MSSLAQPTVRRTRLGVPCAAVLIFGVAAFAACGGDGSRSEMPINNADDAEAALAQAERELRGVVGQSPAPSGGFVAPPATAQPRVDHKNDPHDVPAPPPPPPPKPAEGGVVVQGQSAPGGGDADGKPEALRESPCTVACRALASMRRASDRLCALTSATDARCVAAKDRTQRAEADVKRACGSC